MVGCAIKISDWWYVFHDSHSIKHHDHCDDDDDDERAIHTPRSFNSTGMKITAETMPGIMANLIVFIKTCGDFRWTVFDAWPLLLFLNPVLYYNDSNEL